MLVEDMSSSGNIMMSRLDLAKKYIYQDINSRSWSIALITYDKNASLLVPRTLDRESFREILSAVTPLDIWGGSDLSAGLSLFAKLRQPDDTRVDLVILTDGWWTVSRDILPYLSSVSDTTIVGIGTEVGWRIPLGYNLDGEKRYKYYEWSEVIAHYEKDNIEKLSLLSHAQLVHLEEDRDYQFSASPRYRLDPSLLEIIGICSILLGIMIPHYAREKK